MNRTALTRLVTVLTILALLVMVLPMSVMAKGNGGKTPPGQVQKNTKPETAPKAEPNKSVEAQFVAARNAWAKDSNIGLPPGHVNILYRYLVAEKTIDPASFSEDPANIELAIKAISDYFTLIKSDPAFYSEGRLSISKLMGEIKSLKLVLDETKDEPEDEEEPDQDELPDPDDVIPTPPASIPTPPATV